MEVLECEWLADRKLQKIIEELKIESTRNPGYTWNHDQRYKGRLVLVAESEIKEKVLHTTHDSPLGGYSGVHRTLRRIKLSFHLFGMRSEVKKSVQNVRCVKGTRPKQ